MLKTQTENYVTIKVKEFKRYQHKTKYQKVLEFAEKISNFWYLKNCSITVSFVQLGDDDYGNIMHLSKSNYWINIHGYLNQKDKIETLVHEIGHIKQIESGDMVLYNNGNINWKGITYKSHGNMFKSKDYCIDYYNLPWEIDARFKEKQYWKHNHLKKNDSY